MGRAKYYEYLASRAWALKRESVFARASGLCERCKSAKPDQVHHLSYEHVFDEPLSELQAVCEACHKFLSGKTDQDPADTNTWGWTKDRICPKCKRTYDHCSSRQNGLHGLCQDCAMKEKPPAILPGDMPPYCSKCGTACGVEPYARNGKHEPICQFCAEELESKREIQHE